MSYIIQNDYQKQIQPALLSQVTGNNTTVLLAAEQATEAEIKSYLAQKYDIDKELAAITVWSNSVAYKAGARVYDGSNALYYAVYPFAVFAPEGNYKPGDKVWWNNKTYECLIATSYMSHEGSLQYQSGRNMPSVNVLPDNALIGARYWTDMGAYQVAAGTALNSTAYWVLGDNRNPQLLMYAIDMVLYHIHSRIAPNNIPQLRQVRYSSAIEWLQKAAKGDVTANLPLLQTISSRNIRFGGNVKHINSY